ncbi:uncharacterized protein LDX57_008249 [Aspergillus melleus]|uniref:uncharacterized protein n=1 Tax=Aspergillus melleus TaxID=138277 RepID=UPI001E8DDCC7|nr:uncharacterized protein LDX57_008249 [Aspergillus melleus]KAH8430585.1 hypothetical protein LDX57_008249 [Aspergillus melleus]
MGTPDRPDLRAADSAPASVGPEDSDLDEEPAMDSEHQAVCDEILAPKQAVSQDFDPSPVDTPG